MSKDSENSNKSSKKINADSDGNILYKIPTKRVINNSLLDKNKKGIIIKIAACGLQAVMAVFLIFFSNTSFSAESSSSEDFFISDLTAMISFQISSPDLFAESVRNVSYESPQIATIEQNSVLAVSSPNIITPQALTSIIEETEPTRDSILYYIVESGDTISSLAQKFNISINSILWANDLQKGSTLKVGQEMIILPVSGVLHLVQEGDTLGAIAGSYKGKIDEIVAFNGLKGEQDIYIGDVLMVPEGVITPKAPPVPSSIPIANSYFIIPCEGVISQGAHGYLGAAIDIANSCGKPVVASAGGVVQRSGAIPIGGNVITILHPNGVVTYYGHLSSMVVSAGQKVDAGQIIGYIGNTGYTIGRTGCHLHFETRGTRNFMLSYPVGSRVSWK